MYEKMSNRGDDLKDPNDFKVLKVFKDVRVVKETRAVG